MNLDELLKEFRTSFIWWYFDHYNLCLDPYGYWGEKTERVMLMHMKLSGKKLEKEFMHYVLNVQKYQDDYDCLASLPYDYKLNLE